MDSTTLARLKAHFREWSCGGSPESIYQITVYADYAMLTDLGTKEEVRSALLDWFDSDDPDDDL